MGQSKSPIFPPNSTPKWLLDRFVSVPVLGVVLGATLVIFTAPAWLGIRFIAPEATPFLAGATLAFLILTIGNSLRDTDAELALALKFSQELQDHPARIQLVVLTALAMIPAAGISLHVLAIALIADAAASYSALAVSLPFLLSPLDAYLGRRFGVSFGAAGIWLGVAVIRVIAVLRGVRQEVATEAGHTAQTLLFGPRSSTAR